MQSSWFVVFYLIGIVATSIHFGNGLWNFSCKWGITVTKKSQHAAAYFGAAVAILFTLIGIAIIIGLRLNIFPLGTYTQ